MDCFRSDIIIKSDHINAYIKTRNILFILFLKIFHNCCGWNDFWLFYSCSLMFSCILLLLSSFTRLLLGCAMNLLRTLPLLLSFTPLFFYSLLFSVSTYAFSHIVLSTQTEIMFFWAHGFTFCTCSTIFKTHRFCSLTYRTILTVNGLNSSTFEAPIILHLVIFSEVLSVGFVKGFASWSHLWCRFRVVRDGCLEISALILTFSCLWVDWLLGLLDLGLESGARFGSWRH